MRTLRLPATAAAFATCPCRPGPRLVDALEFLVGLLNNKPELIPAGFPWFYYKPSEAAAAAEAQAQ